MPALMATFQIQLFTNATNPSAPRHRVGGWTESWLEAAGTINLAILTSWAQRRAALLPQGAVVVGARVQQVDPPGASQTYAMNFPGLVSNAADIPQMGLQCKATGAGTRNVRTFWLRGIPDSQVVEGEFTPTNAFGNALLAFFNHLKQSSWEFRGQDLAQVAHPLLSVDTNGIAIFTEPHGLNVGDYCKVLKTVNSAGRQVGGKFYVLTVSSATTCAFSGWNLGATTKGKGRKYAIVYPTVNEAVYSRIGVKKVGRPFDQYRGRRSKRR